MFGPVQTGSSHFTQLHFLFFVSDIELKSRDMTKERRGIKAGGETLNNSRWLLRQDGIKPPTKTNNPGKSISKEQQT